MLLIRGSRVFRYFSLVADRERALWANMFMNIISTHKPPSSIFAPSLIDTLLASKIDTKRYNQAITAAKASNDSLNLDFNYEQQMKALFKDGVKLLQSIYVQDRTNKAKNDSILGKQYQEYKSAQSQKFTFFPSYLVTKEVFKRVRFEKAHHVLFYGNYGTGKTHSFILYQRLSNLISEYVYKSLKNSSEKKVMEKLKEYGLIAKEPRKIIYLNFYAAKQAYQNTNQAIQMQCPELDFSQTLNEANYNKRFDKKVNEFEKKIELLNKSYVRNTETKLVYVVDQINQAVSQFREWNRKIQKCDLLENLGQIESKKKQIDNHFDINNNFQQIIDTIKGQRVQTIYNSSVNIEMGLISQQNYFNDSAKRLILADNHSKLVKIRLPYSQNLKYKWGEVSFKHYLWEETALKLIILNEKSQIEKMSQQKRQYLRLLFGVALEDKRVPVYFHFLNIRESNLSLQSIRKAIALISEKPNQVFITNSQTLKKSLSEAESTQIAEQIKIALNLKTKSKAEAESSEKNEKAVESKTQIEQSGETLFLDAVKGMWHQIEKHSQKQLVENEKNTYLATDSKIVLVKIKLIFHIIEKLQEAVNKEEISPQEDSFVLVTKQIGEDFSKYFEDNDQNRYGSIDRELLDFVIEEDGKLIRIFHSPQTFLRLFGNVLKGYLLKKYDQLRVFSVFLNFGFDQSVAGKMMEFSLMGLFLFKRFEASFDEISLKNLTFKGNQMFQKAIFSSPLVSNFHEICYTTNKIKNADNQQTKVTQLKEEYKQAIKQILHNLFELVLKNQKKQVFAYPFNAFEANKSNFSPNSPTIDFIILEYDSNNEGMLIRTYEITSTMNAQEIFKKIDNATVVLNYLSEIVKELKRKGTQDQFISISHTILGFQTVINKVRAYSDNPNREQRQNGEKSIQDALKSSKWEIKLGKFDKMLVRESNSFLHMLLKDLMREKLASAEFAYSKARSNSADSKDPTDSTAS